MPLKCLKCGKNSLYYFHYLKKRICKNCNYTEISKHLKYNIELPKSN